MYHLLTCPSLSILLCHDHAYVLMQMHLMFVHWICEYMTSVLFCLRGIWCFIRVAARWILLGESPSLLLQLPQHRASHHYCASDLVDAKQHSNYKHGRFFRIVPCKWFCHAPFLAILTTYIDAVLVRILVEASANAYLDVYTRG